MNTILGIWNTGSKGKSTTVRLLADLFISKKVKIIFEHNYLSTKSDFTLIIEYKEKIVAFESKGDPGTGLKDRLQLIIKKHKPDVLITTCRTSGKTVQDILVNKPTHDILWSSTYQSEDPLLFSHINSIKAEHLFYFLVQLGRI